MAGATTFITGAAGFIGTELVKVLKSRGHEVLAVTWSSDAAQRARDAGATAIIGDLRDEGLWQDEVAADWVFHLPPHPQERAGATWTRAAAMSRSRALMDARLLDAAAAGATQRIVPVADTICYGATGARPITEDEQPRPPRWGRCLAPAFNRLDGYVAAGLPIVTALPGWVYGDG
jgi:nucleoside-diphosphate-sugar epimerase